MSITETLEQHIPMLCPYRVGDMHVTSEYKYHSSEGNRIGITTDLNVPDLIEKRNKLLHQEQLSINTNKARTLDQTGEYTPGQPYVK